LLALKADRVRAALRGELEHVTFPVYDSRGIKQVRKLILAGDAGEDWRNCKIVDVFAKEGSRNLTDLEKNWIRSACHNWRADGVHVGWHTGKEVYESSSPSPSGPARISGQRRKITSIVGSASTTECAPCSSLCKHSSTGRSGG
jgi:hypothetical protein